MFISLSNVLFTYDGSFLINEFNFIANNQIVLMHTLATTNNFSVVVIDLNKHLWQRIFIITS